MKKAKRSPIGSWLVSGVIVILAVAAGVFLWQKAARVGAPAPEVAAPAPAGNGLAPAGAATAIRHPIAQAAPATASTAPLPALDESDAGVVQGLLALAGDGALDRLLLHDQIIRRIVATVDALPRRSVAPNLLPVRTPKGAFLVDPVEGGFVLGARNAARYAPYMRVLQGVDAKALVAWYARHYPLFQQAYRDLGYPKGYFNDRLVAAIDDMLAAPESAEPVRLVQPKVFYRYADPALEARSAGQKMMMRLGAADEAAAKARLRVFRGLLTGAALPPAPAASAR